VSLGPPGKLTKEFEMSYKRTALAGLALTSLLAVNAVVADEIAVKETSEAVTVNTDQIDRDRLRLETAAAVRRAVSAVLADTKLDLDIRLIGPTSVKIADDR
jgi:hypothetical protein